MVDQPATYTHRSTQTRNVRLERTGSPESPGLAAKVRLQVAVDRVLGNCSSVVLRNLPLGNGVPRELTGQENFETQLLHNLSIKLIMFIFYIIL